ncbi:hypothetical protein BBJ29_008634 [Phytophthora kernoviae]|uniref:Uncharacterized protein n=1 Tax=Phytophthora kernoviae TaxID=325452 RepID=A0A3R7KG80_9STRA|nr:hypothetical protein BBJ29_008634 [Phytophthora kernoviae]
MVKLVEYPDSSENEEQDVDTRSDGSQWSSFGEIPSDSNDSFSYRMRSPDSEQDDSDEDYAPSQASLSSLEMSNSPTSSVDTSDLEFPSDMEEDEPQETQTPLFQVFSAANLDATGTEESHDNQEETESKKEGGQSMFYTWGDLKAAFEDNPFKRRSVGEKEVNIGAAESEEAEDTSTESPTEQETGNQEECTRYT